MTLIFRSKVLDQSHTGSSYHTIQQRGTDWDSLKNYSNEDIRDIAWSRSTSGTIYAKNRLTEWSIRVIWIFITWTWDHFYIHSYFESKFHAIEQGKKLIEESVKHNNYSYKDYSGNNLKNVCIKLRKQNIKDNLILIFQWYDGKMETPEELKKLSKLNDIIMIDIFHPIDTDPNGENMFHGKILSQKSQQKYKNDLKIQKKIRFHALMKNQISHIEYITNEHLEECLNYFFKKRFHG